MAKASTHTTLRDISFQISRAEARIRRLQYERDHYQWSKERQQSIPVSDTRRKEINSAILINRQDVSHLHEALAPLAYLVSKDLI